MEAHGGIPLGWVDGLGGTKGGGGGGVGGGVLGSTVYPGLARLTMWHLCKSLAEQTESPFYWPSGSLSPGVAGNSATLHAFSFSWLFMCHIHNSSLLQCALQHM